jgi:hypothetical protein
MPEEPPVSPVLPDLRTVSVVHDADTDRLSIIHDDDLDPHHALGLLLAGLWKHLNDVELGDLDDDDDD